MWAIWYYNNVMMFIIIEIVYKFMKVKSVIYFLVYHQFEYSFTVFEQKTYLIFQ